MSRSNPGSRFAPSLWLGPLAAALLIGLMGGLVLQLASPAHRGAPSARAATPRPPGAPGRTIEAPGQARLEIEPNRLDVSLVLRARRAQPRAAAKALRRKRAALLRALRLTGVPKARVLLTGMNLYPIYKRYPNKGIDAYAASITLVATLRDFERLPDVAEAAAAVGLHRMSTRFRSSRLSELKRKARDLAVKAARSNAAQLARSLGIQVGQVLKVVESPAGSWQGWRWHSRGVDNVANDVRNVRSGASPSLRPDAVKLHHRVRATWAIR